MLTVRAIIACLVAAVAVARANIYGNNSVWNVSYGDQVSIPLYKLFETNKDYSVKYETTSNITKIVSREPLFTREIPRNCKGMNLMDLTEAETPNRLSMICNGTDLYEVEIDQSNGKLKEAVLMSQFEAMSCFSADWNKALNIYGVFCQELKGAGKDNFYVVHIVDRATKKVTGASRRNMADQSTYHFVDRVKVRFRDIFKDQSKTTKTTVVTVFDEPFADESINIVAKSNHFLLLTEVDVSTKKPEELLQAVDFSKDNTLNRDKFYKVLTMEVFERDFVIAFYNLEKQLKFGKCTLDLAVAKQAKISDCIFKTSKVEAIGHGMISFFASSVAAIYEKQEKKYLVCSIVVGKSTDTSSPLLDNCNKFDGRVEPDTDVRDFESPKETKLKVLYMTSDKKIDLGMDLITLSTADPKTKTAEIFKAYSNDTAELQNKFYTITDAFLDVFDKSRQEELLVQGTLLPKDGSVQFVVKATHQDKVTTNQLTFTQYSRFLRAIDKIGAFPSLIGSLRNYFRIPIGRQYFSGNGINFNLKGSLDGRLVSNAGEFELVVDNLPNDQIDSFFYKLGYAAVLTKDRRIVIVNCKKALGNSMVKLSCVKIGEKAGLNSDANEGILATYDTQQILLVVTTYGQFIAFNKINHNSKVALEPGTNKAYTQVTFKPNNAFILISVMVADSKGEIVQIKTFKMDEFAALESASFMKGEATLDKDNYSKAEGSQDSAGQFCPRSIAYELQDTPILVVLNACKDRDRRLIRFSLVDPLKPQQLTNQYIRVDAFKKEHILMCTDLDTVTIAAIGDKQALGIGYESHNIQQTLGLQEMDVANITDIKCLGSKAYALGFRDSKGSLKIGTYFTDKLKKANDRLHSLLDFPSDSGLTDFSGSEDNGIIVYSVSGKDKQTQFRMVNLDGPELFVKSNTKTVINDATIDCTNGIANGYFAVPLNFKEQKNSVQVSSRTKNVELSKTKYNVGNQSIVNGPVFHFSLGAEVKTVSITQRVSAAKEYLSSSDARGLKIVFISRVATVGQFTFILAQLKEQSALIMRFNQANKDVTHNFTLTQTCHNFEVTEEATGFLVALSCFYQNEKRIHFVSISKEHKFEYEGASSSLLSSNSMSLTKTADKTYPYLLSNLDENNVMTIFKFYLNKVTDKTGTKISFSQIIHQVENVNMMQVIRSSKRINVIYFTPKDHKGNVFIIDPETSKVTSSTHSTVVTTDFTVVSSFNCQVKPPTDKISTEYIDCIFTTHGPYIFRAQLKEDPGTGLVEVTSSPLKGRFEMFYDNVAMKVTFNENYFAVLSTSVKSGDIRILVYRFLDKQGTSYLWSGIRLEDYSKRRIEDVDLVMHPSDELIFLTNTFEDSSTTTFVKSVQLKEAEITVVDPTMDKLAGERIKFNDKQTDIEQSYVPIGNFFLHLDEQNMTRLFNSNKWYHWIILVIACGATYGYLFFRWKKESLRRQKLREEVLCNNLDDVIKL